MTLEERAKDLAMQYGLIGMEDDLAGEIVKLGREAENIGRERERMRSS